MSYPFCPECGEAIKKLGRYCEFCGTCIPERKKEEKADEPKMGILESISCSLGVGVVWTLYLLIILTFIVTIFSLISHLFR